MGLFMIDEKKLLDTLQQWHDDAVEMKENAIGINSVIRYETEEFVLYKIIDMINENKMLEWLQDEYVKFSRDELREYDDYIYRHLRGKMDLIQDILIKIKQGRFNENQTKDV